MIDKLITIVLIELIIVLGMYIVGWIATFIYGEAEPVDTRSCSHEFAVELTEEQAKELMKVFDDDD